MASNKFLIKIEIVLGYKNSTYLPLKHFFACRDLCWYVIFPWGYRAGESIGIGAIRIVTFIKIEQYRSIFNVFYGKVNIPAPAVSGFIISEVVKRDEQVIAVSGIIDEVHHLVNMQCTLRTGQ